MNLFPHYMLKTHKMMSQFSNVKIKISFLVNKREIGTKSGMYERRLSVFWVGMNAEWADQALMGEGRMTEGKGEKVGEHEWVGGWRRQTGGCQSSSEQQKEPWSEEDMVNENQWRWKDGAAEQSLVLPSCLRSARPCWVWGRLRGESSGWALVTPDCFTPPTLG